VVGYWPNNATFPLTFPASASGITHLAFGPCAGDLLVADVQLPDGDGLTLSLESADRAEVVLMLHWRHASRANYKAELANRIDRDRPLPSDPRELQRVVADLQLFAVHAQDSAMRLLVPPDLQPECPALTPRELESLRWTMEGKTAWEAGAVMGISERTAVRRVHLPFDSRR